MYAGGPAEDCAALALASLEGGALIAADNGFLTVYANNTLAMLERPEAAGAFEACMADAHRRGSLFGVSAARLWRGYDYLRRGELADAESDLNTVMGDFEAWGAADDMVKTYLAAFLALTLLERGQPDAAWAALDARGGQGRHRRRALLAGLAGGAAGGHGAPRGGAGGHRRAGRPATAGSSAPSATLWRSTRARALGRLGRTEEALELLDEELGLARAQGAPGPIGRVLCARGTLLDDGAEDSLREAVEVLERSPARLERARAAAALGSGCGASAGRPRPATRCAGRWSWPRPAAPRRWPPTCAPSCAPAAPARARSALSGVDSLTASERRVATLAADGQTNRDIAQELFVTPKTVEVHLSNTYRKLGLRSRRELPAALAA